LSVHSQAGAFWEFHLEAQTEEAPRHPTIRTLASYIQGYDLTKFTSTKASSNIQRYQWFQQALPNALSVLAIGLQAFGDSAKAYANHNPPQPDLIVTIAQSVLPHNRPKFRSGGDLNKHNRRDSRFLPMVHR
jgi:hypothetical protein